MENVDHHPFSLSGQKNAHLMKESLIFPANANPNSWMKPMMPTSALILLDFLKLLCDGTLVEIVHHVCHCLRSKTSLQCDSLHTLPKRLPLTE